MISLVCHIIVFSEVVVNDASGVEFSVVDVSFVEFSLVIVLSGGESETSGGLDCATVLELSWIVTSDGAEVVIVVSSAGTTVVIIPPPDAVEIIVVDGSCALVVPFDCTVMVVSSFVFVLPLVVVVTSASRHW